MADGSFNPGLTLQQSSSYAAARQAGELERRIDQGVVSGKSCVDAALACTIRW